MKKKKLLYGIGINDATSIVTEDKQHKVWSSIFSRCYSAKCQIHRPTYKGCSVVPEWHRFSVFKEWMDEQDWKGKHIDKDILIPGNKVYGPDTCVFVSNEVNNLIVTKKRKQGKYPIGVITNKHPVYKYKACLGIAGKAVRIGTYATPEEAGAAYRIAKANHVRNIASQQNDVRIKDGLFKHAILIELGINTYNN